MPSELDLRIRETTARLTGEGGPMMLATFRQYGVDLPIIATAPPALTHYFDHFCTQHGATEFIVSGEERLSFTDVYGAARQVAAALVAGYAVQKGDRIGIAMRNAPSWIALYMGVLMAGGVAVLLNGWWQGAELATGIEDVECSLVLVDPPRAARLADHGGAGAAQVITLDIALPLGEALAPLLAKGGSAETPLPQMSGDDLATILFTSGSTGKSKGAFSTHRAVVQGTFNYIAQAMMMLSLATEDGLVSATPRRKSKLDGLGRWFKNKPLAQYSIRRRRLRP
jgi:long-chain acyl-CoA synthetase